jgi:hypothetical protein
MPEHSPVAPESNGQVDYEKTDASSKPVIWIGVGIIVLGLVAHVTCLWLFDVLKARSARRDPGLPPLAARERPKLPQQLDRIPEPRLQVDEAHDLDDLRRQEEKILNGRGWVDAKQGTVQIPIGEAMRLYVEKAKAKGAKQ